MARKIASATILTPVNIKQSKNEYKGQLKSILHSSKKELKGYKMGWRWTLPVYLWTLFKGWYSRKVEDDERSFLMFWLPSTWTHFANVIVWKTTTSRCSLLLEL